MYSISKMQILKHCVTDWAQRSLIECHCFTTAAGGNVTRHIRTPLFQRPGSKNAKLF